jgi:hypothetical protein
MMVPPCSSLTVCLNSSLPSRDSMAKKSKIDLNPNRFAYYLRERGLTRQELTVDGTFQKHFRAWMREVRQRLAVRALNQMTASLNR